MSAGKNLFDRSLEAALNLHEYLNHKHLQGSVLIGPDPGVRFNYRIGRFIKSYLRTFPWRDDYCYLQAQGYWTLANARLFHISGEELYRQLALRCAEQILDRQQQHGAWDYPNSAWAGRIATVEGNWATFGLLAAHRLTSDNTYLDGALKWHRFLLDKTGFQKIGGELAINYFAQDAQKIRVPNNTASTLRLFAELAEISGNDCYLQPLAGMMAFLKNVQKDTGELPYAVAGMNGGRDRPHFQCFQYNAFQCLNLFGVYESTGSQSAFQLAIDILRFLRTGVAADGHAYYACDSRRREVVYHTTVMAAAFTKADYLAIPGYRRLSERALEYALSQQKKDGGFSYSCKDYGLFRDLRSYPRYLAMILYHLLSAIDAPVNSPRHADRSSPH